MAFWIIGYGRVGRRALTRLQRQSPGADFTIVDPHLSGPRKGMQNVQWQDQDGVAFLVAHHLELSAERSPWIVPALPLHLAFEWIAARLRIQCDVAPIPVPSALTDQLPNAVVGSEGQVYMSNADFICPDNCSEPHEFCTATGRRRPRDLYAILSDIQLEGYRSIVVHSRQLAPGVGGYRGRQLEEALQTVQAQQGNVLLSTASKCHGVIHALAIGTKAG